MSTFNTLTSFNFGENFKFYRIRNFNFPEKLRKIVKNRLFLRENIKSFSTKFLLLYILLRFDIVSSTSSPEQMLWEWSF